MNIIFIVVAVLFGAISWICTQTVWEYQYILEYITLFISSFFVCLVFLYQEANQLSKKYKIITFPNLVYLVIILIALIVLRNYDLAEWSTSIYSFWKAVVVMNGIQGILIVLFFKIKDWYNHM